MSIFKLCLCRKNSDIQNFKHFDIKVTYNQKSNYYSVFDEIRLLIKKKFPNSNIIKEHHEDDSLVVTLHEKVILDFTKIKSENQLFRKGSEDKRNFLNKVLLEITIIDYSNNQL